MDAETLKFLKAHFPEPRSCVGYDLKPFSNGHAMLLHLKNSPFVTGGTATITHLALAVLICSRTVEEAEKFLNGKLSFVEKFWVIKLHFFALIFREAMRERLMDFQSYVEAALSYKIKIRSNSKLSRLTTGPRFLGVISALRVKCKFSHSEALNMHMPLAEWFYYEWLEREGAIRFTKGPSEKLKALHRKLVAEREAAKNGVC